MSDSDLKPEVATKETTSTVVLKKSHTTRNILVACGCVLLVCVVVVVAGVVLAPKLITSYLTTSSGPDNTVTKVTESEYKTVEDALNQKLDNQFSIDGASTMELTDKELAVLFSKMIDGRGGASAVGVKLTRDNLRVQMVAKDAFNNINKQIEQINPALIDNLFLTLDIGVAADGHTIIVKNIFTGNKIVDALIPETAKSQLGEGLNSLFAMSDGVSIEKIEFLDGRLRITYAAAQEPASGDF